MKKTRLNLTISLLALAAVLFLAIQCLLLLQSYRLERNRFTFFSQQYVAGAFFQASYNYARLVRLTDELREERRDRIDPDEIRTWLRAILSDYAHTGQRIRERYARNRMSTDFRFAITVSEFIISPGAPTEFTAIKAARPQDDLFLFGDLEGFAQTEQNSTFFLTNPDYYIQIKIYIRHTRLTKFLWKRMAGFLGISSVSVLIVIIIFTFTVFTLLHQKKLAEIRRDFVTHVSHELQTPLGTSSVALSLMREKMEETGSPELRELIDVVQRQSVRLNRLVKNAMEIIEMEHTLPAMKRTRQAVHPLLRTLFQDFLIHTKDQNLSASLKLDATHDIVDLDEFHFTTAVQNILDNAVKYSPAPVRVELATTSDRRQLTVSIADHGIGIKKRDRKKIFEQFVRLQAGPEPDTKGLGLGLFFSASIIRAHGGRINCRSKWGQGTTFEIILPLAEAGNG